MHKVEVKPGKLALVAGKAEVSLTRNYRKAIVRMHGVDAGLLEEVETGFRFTYQESYVAQKLPPIGFTFPLRETPFESTELFGFFDNLAPEGWLLERYCKRYKVGKRDTLGILLVVGNDLPGAVTIEAVG